MESPWPDTLTRLERIYRALLGVYPPAFQAEYGAEMLTLFRDQLRIARRQGGWGVARHLRRTVIDLLISNLAEWRAAMRKMNLIPVLVSAVLLVVPLTFFTLVILHEFLGLAISAEPFYTLYEAPSGSLARNLADIFIILGPLAAVLVSGVPFVRGIRQRIQTNGGLLIAVRETNVLVMGVLLVGLGLGAIFFTYALLENWQCLIGAATSC